MNRSTKLLGATGIAIMLLFAAAPANASVVIDINQLGTSVDVSINGSLNLTGATFDFSEGFVPGTIPGGSNFYIAAGTTAGMDWYDLTSVDVPFGTSSSFFSSPTTNIGNDFSIWGFSGGQPLVGVENGYVSGDAISSDMTFAGETIADMTFIPGTYTFTIPSDTITLNIQGSTVPEPTSLLLLGTGLAGLGLVSFRRKKA